MQILGTESSQLQLKDLPLFLRYFEQTTVNVSDLCSVNLFCWAALRDIRLREAESHLLISFLEDDVEKFYPPFGPSPVEFMKNHKECIWTRIDEAESKQLEHVIPLQVLCSRSDYVYRSADLVELVGKKYDGKRNFIKRCEVFNPVVQDLGDVDPKECLRIYDGWRAAMEPSETIEEERAALVLALEHQKEFNLTGIGVLIEGKLEGFAIGQKLNNTTIIELFEKASITYTGLYAYLLNRFAMHVAPTFEYINREEDLGLENLKKAKESWNPCELMKKYESVLAV